MAVDMNVPSIVGPGSKSSLASDNSIQPFLQDDFDPADYLNSVLPSLSASTTPRSAQNVQNGRSVPLSELNNQLQTLLTQLSAQTSRLSNTLTQLTDEIIRSGGRLAYEVEVLRGDTGTLTETLENGLKQDIELFAPEKLQPESKDESESPKEDTNGETTTAEETPSKTANAQQPEYLDQLQELTAVRSRLDSVIQVFGRAMAWPLAPSELSVTSSIISISGPESGDDTRSREERGKEYADRVRREVNDLLGTGSDVSGLEAAIEKVEELRSLAEIWKGTAEEKARLKFVEGLQKSIDDRQRAVGKPNAGQARKPGVSPSRGVDYRYGNLDAGTRPGEGGYGFLQNLRNLKNEMYLE